MTRRAILAAGTITVCVSVLGAAPENPSGLLRLDRPKYLIELRVEDDSGVQRRAGTEVARDERFFQERLRGDWSGTLVDPRIARFTVGAGGTFSQSQVRGPGEPFAPASDPEFLGRLNLLPAYAVTASAYAERSQSTFINVWSGKTRLERKLWSTALSLKRGPFPMTVAYRQSQLSSVGFTEPFDQTSRTASWTGHTRTTDRFEAQFNQDLERFEDTNSPGYRRYFGQANLNGRPTENQRLYLRADHLDRTGTVAFRRTSAEPTWEYRGKTLKLDTRYRYNREMTGAQRLERQNVSGQMEHQLYDSVKTQLGGEGNWMKQEDGRERGTQGRARLEYTKRIWGPFAFTAHYLFQEHWRWRDFDSQIGSILEETYVLQDGRSTFLNQLFVDTSTVVVISEDRSRQFQDQTDYLLIPAGERLEIRRVITGTIANGQRVLISFRYRQPGTHNTQDEYQDRGIALRLGARGQLYLRQTRQDQRFIGDPEPSAIFDLESFRETSGGVDFQWRYFSMNWSRRVRQSNITPLSSHRAAARVGGEIRPGLTVSAGWSYDMTTSLSSGFTSLARDYSLDSTYSPVGGFLVKLQATTGEADSSGTRSSYDMFFGQLVWTFRSVDLELNNRFTRRWISDAYSRDNFIQLRLTRHF